MDKAQNENIKKYSKIELLLKLVAFILVISCTTTMILIYKLDKMNDSLNRLSYLMDNETESNKYKDTIDIFLEETENGEDILPVYDEYNTTNNESTTVNTQNEISKNDNSSDTTVKDTNKIDETTSIDNTTKTNYVININSNKIHYSSCTFVTRMKEENKKKIELSKNELNNYLNNGYTFCSTCGG